MLFILLIHMLNVNKILFTIQSISLYFMHNFKLRKLVI